MFRFIRSPCGFVLTELVVVLAIIAVLGCTSVLSYAKYVDQARLLRARFELNLMAPVLDIYYIENGEYPADPLLAGINWPHIGPWGEPYEYRGGGAEYVVTARDGEGRKRAEARGKEGVSEVAETRRADDIRAAENIFLGGMGLNL